MENNTLSESMATYNVLEDLLIWLALYHAWHSNYNQVYYLIEYVIVYSHSLAFIMFLQGTHG